jgi:hypothetical protein
MPVRPVFCTLSAFTQSCRGSLKEGGTSLLRGLRSHGRVVSRCSESSVVVEPAAQPRSRGRVALREPTCVCVYWLHVAYFTGSVRDSVKHGHIFGHESRVGADKCVIVNLSSSRHI